jgi:hypothetical protein
MKKLFIIFAILCLAAPAMAADWNFYGSARMATFWIDVDGDLPGDADEDTDLQWDMQSNSRFGANVKFNDQIGGGFEYGHSTNPSYVTNFAGTDSGVGSNNVGLRKLFGTYTFGGGSQLLIGQTYTPSALFYSDSVFDGDGDLLGRGEFYEGRLPMIQWKTGGLKIALIKPVNSKILDEAADFTTTPPTAATYADRDTTIPKIEVGYGFKSDMWFADIGGGYQTFTVDTDTNDIDVDSYVVWGGAGMNLGAFYVKVGAHVGQNLGDFGAYNPSGLANGAGENAAGTDVVDNDGMGYLAVLGFTVSEMFNIEAGYGYESAELDGAVEEDAVTQYYLNTTINIAPGFFIQPEVGMIMDDPAGDGAEPETFYVGAKWQINF